MSTPTPNIFTIPKSILMPQSKLNKKDLLIVMLLRARQKAKQILIEFFQSKFIK